MSDMCPKCGQWREIAERAEAERNDLFKNFKKAVSLAEIGAYEHALRIVNANKGEMIWVTIADRLDKLLEKTEEKP